MARKKRGQEPVELWHQLDAETPKAYEAFKIFMYLPPEDRTVHEAFRKWIANPEKKRTSPYFLAWCTDYAWYERALAHDRHLQMLREEGEDAAIREEAKKQAASTESRRNRYNELMTLGYERAIEWLEDPEHAKANLRSSDVVKIIAIYLEAEKMEASARPETDEQPEWTVEDERDVADLVAEVDAASEAAGLEGNGPRKEEEIPGEDSPH